MYFTRRINFLAIVILFDRLSYLQALTWEVSIHGNQNGEVRKSFNVESENSRIDKEEVYITHSAGSAACLRGPPKAGLNANASVILLTEFYGACDLITKIMNARDAGFFAIIFIRDQCTQNEQEVQIRNMEIDFNVLFTNVDDGENIRDFVMKDSSRTVRRKVWVRSVPVNPFRFLWNWSCLPQKISYTFFSRIKDCSQFINRNALSILGYSTLLLFTIRAGYHFWWHLICWVLLPLLYTLSTLRRTTRVVRVRHFLGLREIIWQDSDSTLPTRCSICLDAFLPGQVLLRIRGCGHSNFHQLCLHQWLQSACPPTCPMCRRRIRESHRGPVEYQRVGVGPIRSPRNQSCLSRLIESIWEFLNCSRDWLVHWLYEIVEGAFDDVLADIPGPHNRIE